MTKVGRLLLKTVIKLNAIKSNIRLTFTSRVGSSIHKTLTEQLGMYNGSGTVAHIVSQ